MANVPIATDSTYGAIKSGGYGIATNTTGNLYVTGLTKAQYDSASNGFGISKKTLENIKQSYVDDILCSTDETQALTMAQKIAAKERIGVRHEQLIEKIVIEDETTSQISRYAEPNGDPYNFAEIMVKYAVSDATNISGISLTLTFQESGIVRRGKNVSSSTRYSGWYWDGSLFGVYSNHSTASGYLYRGEEITPVITGISVNDIVTGAKVHATTSGTYLPKGTEIYIYGIRA